MEVQRINMWIQSKCPSANGSLFSTLINAILKKGEMGEPPKNTLSYLPISKWLLQIQQVPQSGGISFFCPRIVIDRFLVVHIFFFGAKLGSDVGATGSLRVLGY